MNPFLTFPASRMTPCTSGRGTRWPRTAARSRRGKRLLRLALGALLVSTGLGFAAPSALALNVNEATAQQLESIRGIGPRTAEIIVSERERGGKFQSLDDFAERVRGIGQKKAQALEAAGLQVGAGAAAGSGTKGGAAAAVTASPAAAGASGAKPAPAKPAPAARPRP
ncbi:helix-hairpin-helix domain-containing protein [Achromobacter seleniivolatilans]|uniref:Helix-hairpin-helix domain-containing protein n=1 Tax=Achromobacter seleniivolatilans TaxID=3047478 RepID=A0ABY9M947_9BURK|nr:helix-hairpin-helix domain-containing protein [Achromobacter sp. R39]WMD23529.1 helix-hairpin-helix domain-containing protein [Achromobacter sp. R39]